MLPRNATLGGFIAELMDKHRLSNRALAEAAGISEGAVRNLLKYGLGGRAKDPDPRTLKKVAEALDVNPLTLFRLADYLPPAPDAHSARAEYLAQVFDEMRPEKQDAVMGVLEAISDRPARKRIIQAMRKAPQEPFANFDLALPDTLREMANELIAQLQITEPAQLENIDNNIRLAMNRWGDLPEGTQERVKALVRHKLSLNYDPTMVEKEWRW